MPRLPRLQLPEMPLHVVQRGNDHQPCFLDDLDRVRFLDDLRVLSRDAGCAVHAYVLMTNHVHVLLTPTPTGRVDRLMQSLGRRYVRYFNDRHARSGTLWQGRYKAGLVDADDFLLRCYRYIELNPVRAALVRTAADYRWSSYGANALGIDDPVVSPHPLYLALGREDAPRRKNYQAMVAEAIPVEETDLIRQRLRHQQPLGAEGFRELVERRFGRVTGPRRRGRPAKREGTAPFDAAPSGLLSLPEIPER
jgi:putative transposase